MTDLLNVLSNAVATARAYMATPEATARRLADFAAFRHDMMVRFPVLSDAYPYLFEKIVKNEDTEILNDFIAALRQVNEGGRTFESARDEMGRMLNSKFLPTHIGDGSSDK